MEGSRRRCRLGDVFELRLRDDRYALLQYVNQHRDPPVFGPLTRVLRTTFRGPAELPADFATRTDDFGVLCSITAAARRGLVRFVGTAPVPERYASWPLFKHYIDRLDNGVRQWSLWDGKAYTRLPSLPAEHADLPILQIVGFDILATRIEAGWTPRSEVR